MLDSFLLHLSSTLPSRTLHVLGGFGSGAESSDNGMSGGGGGGRPMGGGGGSRVAGPPSDRPPRYPDAHQLFVGNLPLDTTEKELKDFFSQFGNVLELRLNSKGTGQGGNKVFVFGCTLVIWSC